MTTKAFKSAKAPADIQTLRQVAADAGRVLPAAVVQQKPRMVMVNFKLSETLARALAERGEAEGITQKQVVASALAAAGLPVDPLDLQDRTPRRRAWG